VRDHIPAMPPACKAGPRIEKTSEGNSSGWCEFDDFVMSSRLCELCNDLHALFLNHSP
jgi:hypothetical protein